MNQETLQKELQDMIYLVSCAVKEEKPDPERVKAMDLQRVFAIAEGHSLAAAAAFAAEDAGFQSGLTTKLLADAVLRNTRFGIDREEVTRKLEEAGIWYMLLKGAVLKNLYPKPEMREMADHDILFDPSRADDVQTIMESLGYEKKQYNSEVHDIYQKPPVLNFEMHRRLFDEYLGLEKAKPYYENVTDRLLGEGLEKHFSPEDFYVYMIAHEYKHYIIYGTGIRSILDTYVYLSKVTLDEAYVQEELEKIGIAGFEKANRSLAMHLFGDGKLTKEDEEMLGYFFSCGTYGTYSNRISNRVHHMNGSKLRYALSRFFVPVRKSSRGYNVYAKEYPMFYKYKILLPFLPFYRVIRGLRNGKLQKEVTVLKNIKQ